MAVGSNAWFFRPSIDRQQGGSCPGNYWRVVAVTRINDICVREIFRGLLFWQQCRGGWKRFVQQQRWLGVTNSVSVREWHIKVWESTSWKEMFAICAVNYNILLDPAWLPDIPTFPFFPNLLLIKTLFSLSEAIPVNALFFPALLHLSIRGMSFNMPPVTSHSQEAHPASHSPCPLFLNERHMRCGLHWS